MTTSTHTITNIANPTTNGISTTDNLMTTVNDGETPLVFTVILDESQKSPDPKVHNNL